MSIDKTLTLAFRSFALLSLALLLAGSASAQVKGQARVVGFPVSVEGGGTRVEQAVEAKLDDRITVVIEVPQIPDKQAGQTAIPPAGTPPGGTAAAPGGTAAAPGGTAAAPGGTAAAPGGTAAAPDDQSWIPGIALGDIGKLVPYLNGRQLAGVYPESVDSRTHTLTFHLERTEKSEEAWSDLLDNPGFKPKPLPLSVGLEGKQPLETAATLNLVVIQNMWFIIATILFFIVVYVFYRLASRTSLIRDGGVTATPLPKFRKLLWGKRQARPALPPFSLARSQMAFWFFMVIASFVFIWMTTGGTSISSGVLVLIGISAGTALGASAIDSSKPDQPAQKSNGFLNDILSEAKGISFHRFQIVVWTIVLGFVFSRSVVTSLTMMDFPTNLLTLMGISSGTYLGMKLPATTTATADPQPEGNAAGGGAAGGGGAAAGGDAADQ